MSKVFKSTWVIALSLVMLLTACSGGNKGNQVNNAASTGNNNGVQATNGGSSEGEEQEIVELNLFVNMSWWPLKNWSGKIPEEITKKTGVKLNIQVAADDKQLPLLIASGDLPDLVYTATDLTRMANSDVSYPLGDLITKYAPDFQISQERIGVNTMPDGNYYTIKNGYSTEQEWKDNPKALPGGSGLAIRQDILDPSSNERHSRSDR